MFVNISIIVQFINVHFPFSWVTRFSCKWLSIFKVWEHLPDQEYLYCWHLLPHLGSQKCGWGPCAEVLVHNLEWGVVDPSCMGKDKGTGYVVNVHGCISACLELGIPSKHHHLMELLGSVLGSVKWQHTVFRLPGHWGVAGPKVSFHLLKCDAGMVLYVEEWEYLSVNSYCHNLHLPG